MLFPTFDFALFFLVVFTLSWALKSHLQANKIMLLAASYFFYGYWDWRFCFLLMGSSLANYYAGYLIDRAEGVRRKKTIVAAAVVINLLVLGFFKYFGFFMDSLVELLYSVGWGHDIPMLEVILPVGISFFTFQGISYVVDVYRGHVSGGRSMLNVILYISFFPQLVAGPIVRASSFLPQLDKKPDPDRILAGMGILLILWGVFKKSIISNYLAVDLVDDVFFDPSVYSPVDLMLALYGYSIQLYCDFSAYSDIAIGTAALLGYRFPRNFNQPWRSETMAEFWRRWHISLSTWLRDYLYIPLGGSREKGWKTHRNLLITMFLGGIWHGAGWTYVFWSVYMALALDIERLLGINGKPGSRPPWRRIVGVLIVFHIMAFSWILFRAESLDASWQYLTALFTWGMPVVQLRGFVVCLILFGVAINFAPGDILQRIQDRFVRLPVVVQGILAGLVLLAIDAFGPEGVAPFIYFQF